MHSFSFWSHLFKMWDWKFFPWQKGGTNIVPPLSKLKFFDTPKQNPNPILETDAWNDLAKKFLQAIVLLPCSAANKGWSMVNYHQSLTFERPYFCQWSLWPVAFQRNLFYYYYYFLEVLLNNLELFFLEFKQFYKTHRTSLFFTFFFVIILCINALHLFLFFPLRIKTGWFSFCLLSTLYINNLQLRCRLTLFTLCTFHITSS